MQDQRSERGAAAVEFALIVPLMLVVLFAILDLGWVFNQQLAVTAAAREGARIAAVHSDAAGQADAEDLVNDLLTVTPTITWESACGPATDDRITMVVSVPLTDLTGWLTAIADEATLEGRGSMRCGG
ncbi:pilus assembly protein [Streptomyces sp. ISL-90]|nr:pilus assembly protein [Streptomyces sp. ISL-90]